MGPGGRLKWTANNVQDMLRNSTQEGRGCASVSVNTLIWFQIRNKQLLTHI